MHLPCVLVGGQGSELLDEHCGINTYLGVEALEQDIGRASFAPS